MKVLCTLLIFIAFSPLSVFAKAECYEATEVLKTRWKIHDFASVWQSVPEALGSIKSQKFPSDNTSLVKWFIKIERRDNGDFNIQVCPDKQNPSKTEQVAFRFGLKENNFGKKEIYNGSFTAFPTTFMSQDCSSNSRWLIPAREVPKSTKPDGSLTVFVYMERIQSTSCEFRPELDNENSIMTDTPNTIHTLCETSIKVDQNNNYIWFGNFTEYNSDHFIWSPTFPTNTAPNIHLWQIGVNYYVQKSRPSVDVTLALAKLQGGKAIGTFSIVITSPPDSTERGNAYLWVPDGYFKLTDYSNTCYSPRDTTPYSYLDKSKRFSPFQLREDCKQCSKHDFKINAKISVLKIINKCSAVTV